MNYLQVIKAYQEDRKSIGFRRKGWDDSQYCYISDIDFCIYIVYGTPDEDACYSSALDIQMEDWELAY